MIERLVESWLDSANERAFQIPFCQALAACGHAIIYVSPHGILEQGKDVISRDAKGKLHAYQLKSGNVTSSAWRNEIKGELEMLCDLPLRHPSIPPKERMRFTAHLVCSGEIKDSVRNDLDAMNEARRLGRKVCLETITQGELLSLFQKTHGRFLPDEPANFREFLTLYLHDGRERPLKHALSSFMLQTLSRCKGKTDLARGFAALAVLVGYVAGGHYHHRNHLAVAEIWIMYAAHVAAIAAKRSLASSLWRKSFDLALDGAADALEQLTQEALSRDILNEGDALVDGVVYRQRVTLLCGWLAAWELFKQSRRTGYEPREDVRAFVERHIERVEVTTEADVPPIFAACKLLQSSGATALLAESLIGAILGAICSRNRPGQGTALPNCYYDYEEAVDFLTKRREPEEDFGGRSMTAAPLVDHLARRLRKGLLADLWYELSGICYEQFCPRPSWQYGLWAAEKGEVQARFFGRPQNWASLLDDARTLRDRELPAFLREGAFALLFALTYPHRFTRVLVAQVDQEI